eukprot:gnl/TRDRNA2_/TRDRNA2_63595_c0_seq1.p1 gnl/TRDRNA2_/TRDRNA2_63595_c0~~gnl/TRDRNA2_/TRDRNA2_63595_c0_seq1.p1  ORF type:complete len:595 (-),score=75.78 gnl/TRDRNA2_/TRDRNA2_63595_c0_seq1:230-2014(-)
MAINIMLAVVVMVVVPSLGAMAFSSARLDISSGAEAVECEDARWDQAHVPHKIFQCAREDDDFVSLLQTRISVYRSPRISADLLTESTSGTAHFLGIAAISPVSASSLQVIMLLAVLYFVVFCLLALLRTWSHVAEDTPFPCEKVLESVSTTMNFPPALCVLLLVAHMLALKPSTTPQGWIQVSIDTCGFAVLVQTALHILGYLVGLKGRLFWLLRHLTMLVTYVAYIAVVIGVLNLSKEEPESPQAVLCIVVLSLMFVIVYFVNQMCVLMLHLGLGGDSVARFLEVMKVGATAIDFAPMLCILFVAALVRAGSIGMPQIQLWAQHCMWASVSACMANEVMILTSSYLTRRMFIVVQGLSWVAMVVLYVSVISICISMWTLKSNSTTPQTSSSKFSTATWCIWVMTAQFFSVYFFIWFFHSLKHCAAVRLGIVIRAFTMARETVFLCPMISVLFMGTELTARAVSGGRGSPQDWVEGCMMGATLTLLTQMALDVLVSSCVVERPSMAQLISEAQEPDREPEAGETPRSASSKELTDAYIRCVRALKFMQSACTFAMYGFTFAVMAGVFWMRYENTDVGSSGLFAKALGNSTFFK